MAGAAGCGSAEAAATKKDRSKIEAIIEKYCPRVRIFEEEEEEREEEEGEEEEGEEEEEEEDGTLSTNS